MQECTYARKANHFQDDDVAPLKIHRAIGYIQTQHVWAKRCNFSLKVTYIQ